MLFFKTDLSFSDASYALGKACNISYDCICLTNHSFCSPGLQKCLILPQSSKIHIQLKAQEERGASEQERLMSKMLRLKWELQQRRWARSIPNQPATTMSEGKSYVLSYWFLLFLVSISCVLVHPCLLSFVHFSSFIRSFVRVGQHGLLR